MNNIISRVVRDKRGYPVIIRNNIVYKNYKIGYFYYDNGQIKHSRKLRKLINISY